MQTRQGIGPFLALPFICLAMAQEAPPTNYTLETIAPLHTGSTVTKHIVMVVDVSGSMDDHLDSMLWAFDQITRQPTDELYLKVYAFSDATFLWRPNWTPLPDANALKEARSWLHDQMGHGNTYPAPALARAMDQPEAVTVVLMTDGLFTHPQLNPELFAVVQLKQQERVSKKRAPCAILVVDPDTTSYALRQLVKMTNGAYYHIGTQKGQ